MAKVQGGQSDLARLSSEHSAVVVLRPPRVEDVTAARGELEAALVQLYRGLRDVHVTVWATAHAVVAVVSIGQPTPSARPAGLVWGLPVAPGGEPGDATVREALVTPSMARGWLGGFLLADLSGQRLRMVTSTDLRPTLRMSEGPAGTAFATASLAAVVAAGRRPRVDPDRIAEIISLGAVLGDDELIADVGRLPEGSIVDLDASGVTIETAGSRRDRLAPGPASTPERLRASVGDAVEAFAAVPNLHLAMTGGRDSLLIASCAAERDITLPTFTFGPSPDSTAAAAVAESLGWSHRQVGFGEGERRLDDVVRLSSWTEGAVTAWDLAGPGPVWPGEPGAVWLAGLGGETGRAFYWDDHDVPSDPAAYVTERVASTLPPPVRRHLLHRMQEVLGSLSEDTGRSGAELLDVLYALGRARGWMLRHRPMPFLRSMSGAYTSPAVTSVLLDLPRRARLDGSGFDRALALGPPLRELAAEAITPRRASPLQRARRFLGWGRRQAADPGGVVLVEFAHELAADSIVRATLGDGWWRWMVEHAPYDAAVRLQGWQAVAVDALERRINT